MHLVIVQTLVRLYAKELHLLNWGLMLFLLLLTRYIPLVARLKYIKMLGQIIRQKFKIGHYHILYPEMQIILLWVK